MKKRGPAEKPGNRNIDLLIENSIALQKVLTNLATNIDVLSKDVKRMVELFEEADKAFVTGKRPVAGKMEKTDTKILHDRLDELIEQNKVMAKGIMLLESCLRGKSSINKEIEETGAVPKKLPQFNF